MATIQRESASPSSSTLPPSSIVSQFDPLAVPSPYEPTASTSSTYQDLLDLSEEPLFSGVRNSKSTNQELGEDTRTVELGDASGGTGVVEEELMKSLGAAKLAFLIALRGLIIPHETLNGNSITSTADRTANSLLLELLVTLRIDSGSPSGSGLPPMTNAGTSSQQAPLSDPSSRNTSQDTLYEELSTLLSARLASSPKSITSVADQELASTLGTLLVALERLEGVCRAIDGVGPRLSNGGDKPSVGGSTGAAESLVEGDDVYQRLERETKVLRGSGFLSRTYSSGTTPQLQGVDNGVIDAARDVQIAERDLLWGRVDDLSERVAELCRSRDEGKVSRLGDSELHKEGADTSLYEASISDLPEYETEHSHHPPAYLHTSTSNDIASRNSPDQKAPLPAASDLSSHQSRRYSSEKMQLDLDSISTALERLYLVSPQLVNQRVAPDKRQLRERQLAQLGNAIERLSKGRLESQRATIMKAGEAGIEKEEERRVRREQREMEERQLMFERIEKAAGRTLSNQRVDMSSVVTRRREWSEESMSRRVVDSSELVRQDFILRHTGKGRLNSQDATFTTPSSTSSPSLPFPSKSEAPRPTSALSVAEFFRDGSTVERARSISNPTHLSAEPMKKKFSGRSLFGEKGEGRGEEKGSSTNGLSSKRSSFGLSGVFNLGRRGSTDSRSEVPSVLPPNVAIDFVAEESRNLGTVVVTCWPRTSLTAGEEWSIAMVESKAIFLTTSKDGPCTRIPLPCQIAPQQTPALVLRGAFYEIKLNTIDHSTAASRPRQDQDLINQAPLSTAELRDSLPPSYVCSTCSTELVDAVSILKYNALPSEHWAELLDSWMCHGDQRLSEDLIEKGKGIKPRDGEGMVGDGYILFRSEVTKNWSIPKGTEPTRSEADDLLHAAHCTGCQNLIGQFVTSLSSDPAPTHLRLLKYATSPSGSSTSVPLRKYSLASHLMAEMLEIGRAHACHRFVVMNDDEGEKERLMLWLFNPAVRLSFSSEAIVGTLLDEKVQGGLDGKGGENILVVERTMNAVKVFYTIVTDENDAECQEFLNSPHSTTERIYYPRSVTRQLEALLVASTSVYPIGKRKWGDMDAGFLERI